MLRFKSKNQKMYKSESKIPKNIVINIKNNLKTNNFYS